jgi:hypothetical protein
MDTIAENTALPTPVRRSGERSKSGLRRDGKPRMGLLRSRVTNGKSPFVETSATSAWARRWRDIEAQIISDVGGADLLSEGQRQLIRRVTTISIQCELLEGRIAKGEMIDDTDGICASTSSIRQWR